MENVKVLVLRLGAGLNVSEIVLCSKVGRLFIADFARTLEVCLVPNHEHDRVGAGEDLCVVQPVQEMLERAATRDVIDKKRARSPAVVTPAHGLETLLTSCVPDLELCLCAVDVNHFGPKLDSDSVL